MLKLFGRNSDSAVQAAVDPATPAVQPEDLLARSDAWRSEVRTRSTQIVWLSLGLLLWLELSLNSVVLMRYVRPQDWAGPAPSDAVWDWSLGIEDGEATAIVLAMLAVVASINIAVGLSIPAVTEMDRSRYEDVVIHVWSEHLVTVAKFAALAGVVVAGTRLPKPGIFVLLLSVAALTVLSASATLQRQSSQLPLLLNREEIKRNAQRLRAALDRLPGNSGTTTFFERVRRLTLFCLGTSVLISASGVLLGWAVTTRPLGEALRWAWSDFWELFGFGLVLSTPGLAIIIFATQAWKAAAQGRKVALKALGTLTVGVALLWATTFGGLLYRTDQGGLALALWGGLMPLVVPAVVLVRAQRKGSWPVTYAAAYFRREINRLEADEAALNTSIAPQRDADRATSDGMGPRTARSAARRPRRRRRRRP